MGFKGSKATQTTNQTQKYEADPRIQQSAYKSLDKAGSAADQPFQMPVAPVAGFNPFQEQSFNQVLDMQGQFSPYAQAARQYWQNSAAPVTGADVAQYYNPMADSVFANLREDQGKQWNDTTQKLTGAAGGVGASRIAVGQAELGRQQNLASGQIGAQLYQQALQAAQQQKQAQAAAGTGMLNVGSAQQGASTKDIAMLGQAGLQQQQQQQAQLNAPYQNRLAELAYPFQTAQYLAGITGGLAGALGGTTNGQSTTTYQPPQPSGWAQGLGLGMQGLGMFAGLGGVPGISSLFSGAGGAGAGGAGMFLANRGGAVPYAEGGAVDEGTPTGIPMARGLVPAIPLPMSQGHSGPLVGGINLQHQKMPSASGDTSNVGAASKAIGQLGGMLKGKDSGGGGNDDYEPDSEADGGAVFPKHFYAKHLDTGGVGDDNYVEPGYGPNDNWGSTDNWFSDGPKAVNRGPGMGVPGIDFEPDRKNIPEFKMPLDTSSWGDPTGGGIANRYPSSVAQPYNPVMKLQQDAANDHKFNQEISNVSPIANINTGVPNPYRAIPAQPAQSAANQYEAAGDNTPGISGDVFAGAAPSPNGIAENNIPFPRPRPPAAPEGGIHPYGHAIAVGESGGRYDAIGPRTDNGDRAWGKYQVMGANIPTWTEKYYGTPLTPEQFLQNKAAQEAVFRGEFGRLQAKYGPLGAARAWFAGEGGMNKMGAKDILGTSVAGYERKFAQNAGIDTANGGDSYELGATGRQRPRGVSGGNTEGYYELPRARMPYPDSTQRDWGQRLARSPWLSLVKAGAVTASTPGPLGVALARGIGAGADQLQSERGQLRGEEAINQRAQALHTQAQQHFDQFNKTTPYQDAQIAHQKDVLEQGKYTPFNTRDGRIAIFNSKDRSLVDSETGEPVKGDNALSRPGGTGAGSRGQQLEHIANLRAENPKLSYAEALALAQSAPKTDQILLRKEGHALTAAKADTAWASNPEAALKKWRNNYGLKGEAPTQEIAKSMAPGVSKQIDEDHFWDGKKILRYDATKGDRKNPAAWVEAQ